MTTTRDGALLPRAVAGGCAAIAIWCASGASAADAQSLSQKPPESAATTTFEAGTSTIAPRLEVSWRALGDAANAAADKFAGPRSGTTRIGCGSAQTRAPGVTITAEKGCLDFDWHVTAARNGAITARRAGDGVAFAIPVKFNGTGGFRGDLAKTLQLDNKDFNGSFVVAIAGHLKADQNFCPKLEQPATHFAWGTAPQIDLVKKTCIDAGAGLKACLGPWKLPVGAMLTGEINRSLADQVNAINGKMACEHVRDALKNVWKPWTLAVTLQNAQPFYATIEPKALSIPGVSVDDDGIRLAARLDAATRVSSDKPVEAAPAELPPNTMLASEPGRFSLHVPLAVPYTLLASTVSAKIAGKPVRAHGGAITPTKIEMFPSNDRLAIGVTFRADAPAKLKGQTATVWYTAVPGIEQNGHLIRLNDLAMTQKSEGPLWALAPAIDALPKAVAAGSSFDLGPLVHDAETKVHQAIADPKNTAGANVAIANDDLKLGRTALLKDAFVVQGDFEADVNVALGEPGRQANAAPQ